MSSASTSATGRTRSTSNATELFARLEEETGRPIGVLTDLRGPKLRVDTFVPKYSGRSHQASVTLEDNFVRPGGRAHEAVELRDGDKSRCLSKGRLAKYNRLIRIEAERLRRTSRHQTVRPPNVVQGQHSHVSGALAQSFRRRHR